MWYLSYGIPALWGGLLSFCTVFVEMFFILSSVWQVSPSPAPTPAPLHPPSLSPVAPWVEQGSGYMAATVRGSERLVASGYPLQFYSMPRCGFA